MARRAAALATLVTLILGAFAAVVQPASALSPAHTTAGSVKQLLSLSAPAIATSSVNLGDSFTVSGSLTTKTARVIALQRSVDDSPFQTIARGKSKSDGSYAFTQVARVKAQNYAFRVVAPGVKNATGKTIYARLTTPQVTIGVVDPLDHSDATQFHAIVALPSDQVASALSNTASTVAAVRATLESVNTWFGAQTDDGREPNWARDADGNITVTFVVLPRTTHAYDTEGVNDGGALIKSEIATADDQLSPSNAATLGSNERGVVFLNAGSTDPTVSPYCAWTDSTIMTVLFESACGLYPTTNPPPVTKPGGGITFALAHELTRAFGATDPNDTSGNYTCNGSVNDPKDILYVLFPNGCNAAGTIAGIDWANLSLDPGHDDYYGLPDEDGWTDIAFSPLWTDPPTPAGS